ncbi:MAG: thioredoxin fold domain-containing protein [Rhodospirillales bacterium]|nr:thioredoxin fold domain-containing protein [Rhodospirillales bacterium]
MRRTPIALTFVFALLLGPTLAPAAEPKVNDDGLYTQDWFKATSFLILKEDLAEATAKGRRLAILWEQKGCPYCKEMHAISLADPKTSAYIRERFDILQLNLWGDREVEDFDGQKLSEKELARKYRINFTPTVQFFPESPAELAGKKGEAAEVARLPGFFRPFHFLGMFEYVQEKRYAKGQDFQRYIMERAEAARARGERIQ